MSYDYILVRIVFINKYLGCGENRIFYFFGRMYFGVVIIEIRVGVFKELKVYFLYYVN